MALTAVNYRGIRKTAWLTWTIVVVVLSALVAAGVAALSGGQAHTTSLVPLGTGGPRGVLQAAGVLLFTLAGYARIATLGEEARDPERVTPRAIPLALAITLAVYVAVAVSALVALGPDRLAREPAPRAAAASLGCAAPRRPGRAELSSVYEGKLRFLPDKQVLIFGFPAYPEESCALAHAAPPCPLAEDGAPVRAASTPVRG